MLNAILLTTIACLSAADDRTPRGEYVEARTASVYAGACHYGSEYMTAGRAAVLGWSFDAGAFDGVALAGLDVVVAVAADRNLADGDAVRRSVVYLPEAAEPRLRAAALGWLRRHHARTLGEVVAVRFGAVDVARAGDAFVLRAADTIELTGATMPDRACCRMPFNVWYEPFAELSGRLVGVTEVFRLRERELGRRWSRPGENAVFVGRFGPVPATGAAAPQAPAAAR